MYAAPLPQHHIAEPNTHHQQIVDSDGTQKLLFQVWKGRNKFIFGGRLVFGPDVKSLFLTLFLILSPIILFWVFVAKGLVSAFSHGSGLLIVVLSVILTAYIIILLFLTSGRDPGIIPRNLYPPELDDGDTSSLSTDWCGSQINAPSIPLTKNITVNGKVVKVKFCQTCMFYRPPRCSHCSICNNCVERFDHHCPWVGQCIGKRNYRYFFMFVSSTTFLCLFVLASCWINIKGIMEKEECRIWEAIEITPVSGVLIIYTFVVGWFVGGLTAFHLYLIATNQTTYENFRYQYDRKMNPYNLGCVGNFNEIFCSKIPSSRNNFREKVKGDHPMVDFSFSSYSGSRTISRDMMQKGSGFDIDMRQRQAVDADEIEDIRKRVRITFGELERCRTEPRNEDDWDRRVNLGLTSDKHILVTDFWNESSIKDRAG